MSDYVLSCCSTADLTRERFQARNIHYICFHYRLNGTERPDDLGESLPFPEFYRALAEGAEVSTSQPGMGEYLDYFSSFLEAGQDILHISLSSGLSGAMNGARGAARIAMERYPGRTVRVVDSLGASTGYGLFVETLADLRDTGMGLAELGDWAEKNRLRLNHLFTSSDLSFYVRGGRISRTAAVFGGALHICPVLDMDDAGRLVPRARHRGRRHAAEALVKKMAVWAENGPDYAGRCYLCHTACEADARSLALRIEEQFPALRGKTEIYSVGTVIGSHCGPGTVALFFWGRERTAQW